MRGVSANATTLGNYLSTKGGQTTPLLINTEVSKWSLKVRGGIQRSSLWVKELFKKKMKWANCSSESF